MTTPTKILTPEQVGDLYQDWYCFFKDNPGSAALCIQAIEQAVLQSPEVQARQWQPIETAPKDGRTLLLGYYNSHGNWRTMRGQWMSEAYIAEHWEDPDDEQPGWFETSVEADDPPNCWPTEPTHWMPLPAPPADAAMEVKPS